MFTLVFWPLNVLYEHRRALFFVLVFNGKNIFMLPKWIPIIIGLLSCFRHYKLKRRRATRIDGPTIIPWRGHDPWWAPRPHHGGPCFPELGRFFCGFLCSMCVAVLQTRFSYKSPILPVHLWSYSIPLFNFHHL